MAWTRSVSGYGLDTRTTRGYLDSLQRGAEKGRQELVPAAAQAAVQKALTVRADALAGNETRSAVQVGQAAAWIWLEHTGRLPAGSAKEWDIHAQESTCAICRELHSQRVPVDAPFVLRDGTRLWAPQAHPGCTCVLRFVKPGLSKAYDPKERREPPGGPRGGRWTKLAYAEPEPETGSAGVPPRSRFAGATSYAEPEAEPETQAEPASKYGAAAESKYAGLAESKYAAAAESKYAPSKYAAAESKYAPSKYAPSKYQAAAEAKPATQAGAKAQQRVQRRLLQQKAIFLVPARAGKPPPPPPGQSSWYVRLDDIGGLADVTSREDSVLNFDVLHRFRQSLGEPRRPISAVPDQSPWHVAPPANESFAQGGVTDEEWTEIMGSAVPLWHYARNHPELASNETGDLDDTDIMIIARRAGAPPDVKLDEFRDLIQMPEDDQKSVNARNAYADYMVWDRPDVLPELGDQNLYDQTGTPVHPSGDALMRRLAATGWFDRPMSVPALLTFNRSFNHPGPSDVQGPYKVEYVHYNSAIDHFNYDVPQGDVGILEYSLDPIGESGPLGDSGIYRS